MQDMQGLALKKKTRHTSLFFAASLSVSAAVAACCCCSFTACETYIIYYYHNSTTSLPLAFLLFRSELLPLSQAFSPNPVWLQQPICNTVSIITLYDNVKHLLQLFHELFLPLHTLVLKHVKLSFLCSKVRL